MNYAQVLEQIEQLKIGKKVPDMDTIIKNYSTQKIIYIPAEYEYDFVGEFLELLLKIGFKFSNFIKGSNPIKLIKNKIIAI